MERKISASYDASNVSLAVAILPSSRSMKQRLAAAGQWPRLRFIRFVAPDGCLAALTLERAMALGLGPRQSSKNKRTLSRRSTLRRKWVAGRDGV